MYKKWGKSFRKCWVWQRRKFVGWCWCIWWVLRARKFKIRKSNVQWRDCISLMSDPLPAEAGCETCWQIVRSFVVGLYLYCV